MGAEVTDAAPGGGKQRLFEVTLPCRRTHSGETGIAVYVEGPSQLGLVKNVSSTLTPMVWFTRSKNSGLVSCHIANSINEAALLDRSGTSAIETEQFTERIDNKLSRWLRGRDRGTSKGPTYRDDEQLKSD